MKKAALVSLAAVVLITPMVGCYGPNNISAAYDDWWQGSYQEIPWLWGNVVFYSVLSWVGGLLYWIDGIINIYWFWVKDAQPFGDGKGTTHTHKTITPKAK
jgi:hypothetical protein